MTVIINDTSGQDIYIAPPSISQNLKKYGIVALVAIVLVVFIAWPLSAVMSADRVLNRDDLRLAVVERGNLIREISAVGRIIAANSPTLFSQESGTIDLLVKAGDSVPKGQVIAKLISPDLQESLTQQVANLDRLQIQLEGARIQSQRQILELQQQESMAQVNLKAMDREKRRANAAYELKLISALDYEEAMDNLSRAQLEYEQAKKNNALEQKTLDFNQRALQLEIDSQQSVVDALTRRVKALDITSPVDGMIGSVQVEERQAVTNNQALITVVDLKAFEIEARVSEGYVDHLSPGLLVQIQVGNSIHKGELAAISPEVTNSEVVMRIKFVGELPENLRQNQRLSSRILLENIENTLKLSSGAFFDNFRGEVFKVVGGKAERVRVSLGSRSLREIEISSGLVEGDTVIVSALDYSNEDQNIIISH